MGLSPSERRAKEQRQLDTEKKREEISLLFRTVFGSPNGKKVLAAINNYCGHGQDAFGQDERQTSYTLGRQSVSRMIENQIVYKSEENNN